MNANVPTPIFVVNLKKDVKRKAHMETVAKSLGLEFTFIEAVYGKDLAKEEVDKICNYEATQNKFKRDLFPGEIGVALSQMSVYQKMVDENIKYAIVLEDDAVVGEGIHEVLESINSFPTNWELMLLGYYRHSALNKYDRISFRSKSKISDNYQSVRFIEPMHGAHGYLINLKGAKRLLNTLNKGLVLPLDLYTGDSRYINVYGTSPKCVGLDLSLLSTIDEDRDLHFGVDGEHKAKKIDLKDKFQALKKFLRVQKREWSYLAKRLEKPVDYK